MLSPFTILAHEVYVLTPEQIEFNTSAPSINPFSALADPQSLKLFIFFAVFTVAILALALFLKSTKPLKKLGKLFDKIGKLAPDLIRVAFGASLILSASNGAVFGPELPIDSFSNPELLRAGLLIGGVGLTIGLFTRWLAYLAVIIFAYAFIKEGLYMLTYLNYLGEAIAVLLLPVQNFSLDKPIAKLRNIKITKPKYAKFSMPVARILFGLSLLYTAIDIKFVDAAVSLDVVNRHQLTDYFPFDPLFIVLGAGLVEILIAVLFITGLLQRFNSVFFLVFLILSVVFFKEDIWPHYLLIALGVGIFLHKPDIWAADRYLFSSKRSGTKNQRG